MLNDFQISVKSGPAQRVRGQLRSLQPALFQFFVDVTAVFLAVLIAHIGVQALSTGGFLFPFNSPRKLGSWPASSWSFLS